MIDFPEVAPGERLVVSATLFVTYGKCPDQALGRMRGFYPPESRASFKGGLAHRVFARHLSGGEIGASEFDRVCKEEIGSSMNPKLGSLGLKPSQLSGVIREVGDLYERFKTISTEGFQGSEVQLDVDPAQDLTLRGSIDAIFDDDGGVRLVDWKTGGLYEVIITVTDPTGPQRVGNRLNLPNADVIAATGSGALAFSPSAIRLAQAR